MKSFPYPIFLIVILMVFSGCQDQKEDPCKDVDCGPGTCKWTREKIPYCECPEGFSPYGTECLVTDHKPMIYLYPAKSHLVTVRFMDPESPGMLHSYPAYEGQWQVLAHPDGTLQDPTTGHQYYGLFWEGTTAPEERPATGFIVAGSETVPFLEDTLDRLGLNWRETNEFIVFWLPVLEASPYNFLHFSTHEWIRRVPIGVTPEPDSVLRFSMLYEPLVHPPDPLPAPQSFPPFERLGFTLVEWGGARMVSP